MTNLAQQLNPILNTPNRPLASMAVVIFRDGQQVDEAYLGYAQIGNDETIRSKPVDASSKFRVASISKLVATLGVMQLVEQGKLSLDVDVNDWLGFPLRNPNYPETPITLRNLLNHTSSIRDGDAPYSIPISQTMRDFFFPDGAAYADGAHWAAANEPPGVYFHYCNLNFGLVGTLIEIASGQRFDQYMRQQIFEPLGIDVSYNVRDFSDDSLASLATLYRKQDVDRQWDAVGPWYPQVDDYNGIRPDKVMHFENPAAQAGQSFVTAADLERYQIGTNGTIFSPQGGLRISARGLATIGLLFCNGGEYGGVRLLQSESVTQMLTPTWRYDLAQPNGNNYRGLMRAWGLSVQLITNTSAPGNGDRLVQDTSLNYAGHAGDAYGLHSGLWFDVAAKTGFVYIVGGVGADPELNPGEYSSFYRWEEEIMTTLYGRLAHHRESSKQPSLRCTSDYTVSKNSSTA